MDYLLFLLTILGIILVITLIILGVRLNFTVTKFNLLIDDVQNKISTVNKVFDLADKMTDAISLVSDRLVDGIVTFIANVFSGKKRKKEIEEEEF